MPNWLIVGLFVAILSSLAVVVWWEFVRARDTPHSMKKAVKRYLQSGALDSRPHLMPEATGAAAPGRRAFDTWD